MAKVEAKVLTDLVEEHRLNAEAKQRSISELMDELMDAVKKGKWRSLNTAEKELLDSEDELKAQIVVLKNLSESLPAAVENAIRQPDKSKETVHVIIDARGVRFTCNPHMRSEEGKVYTVEVGDESVKTARKLNKVYSNEDSGLFSFKVSEAYDHTLDSYIGTISKRVKEYTVPGSKVKGHVLVPSLKRLIQSGLDHLIDNYYSGKTVKNFVAADLFVKNGLLVFGYNVKMSTNTSLLKSSLACFEEIVRKVILKGVRATEYPADLKELLILLNKSMPWPTEEPGLKSRVHLIKHHCALMGNLKADEFGTRLHNIQDWFGKDTESLNSFNYALNKTEGVTFLNWGKNVTKGSALRPVYTYNPDPTKAAADIPRYDDSTSGLKLKTELIKFIRNCIQHMGSHFKVSALSYKEDEIAKMIAVTFPGFLAKLQFQLAEADVLEDVMGY